jgi:hypothetical protein
MAMPSDDKGDSKKDGDAMVNKKLLKLRLVYAFGN